MRRIRETLDRLQVLEEGGQAARGGVGNKELLYDVPAEQQSQGTANIPAPVRQGNSDNNVSGGARRGGGLQREGSVLRGFGDAGDDASNA